MPRNGSGVFSPPAANYPAVSGTAITAANRNAIDADIATALTGSIAANGETVITNDISMYSHKLTSLTAGTDATDAANLSQVQSGVSSLLASVTGTDTITATLSPTLAAYASGQMFKLVPANTNTGAVTININGLGAKNITKNGTSALVAGDLVAGAIYLIEYDGTRFQTITAGTYLTTTDGVAKGLVTASGLTQSTSRILGRTTASTGAVEEISVGDGLSFTAGVLKSSGIYSNGLGAFTGTASMTSADVGRHANYSSASAGTLTLPDATSLVSGSIISITNIGNGVCTITRAGTSTISAFGVTGATSITLNLGDSIQLATGGTNWVQVTGNNSIGVGQTWQNVTGSRVSGTTYTNSTGKAIQVSVYGTTTGAGSGVLSGTVAGVIIASSVVYGVGSGYSPLVTFIVPNGATYVCSYSGSGGGSITVWAELR